MTTLMWMGIGAAYAMVLLSVVDDEFYERYDAKVIGAMVLTLMIIWPVHIGLLFLMTWREFRQTLDNNKGDRYD